MLAVMLTRQRGLSDKRSGSSGGTNQAAGFSNPAEAAGTNQRCLARQIQAAGFSNPAEAATGTNLWIEEFFWASGYMAVKTRLNSPDFFLSHQKPAVLFHFCYRNNFFYKMM